MPSCCATAILQNEVLAGEGDSSSPRGRRSSREVAAEAAAAAEADERSALAAERASLPIAAYREEFLAAVEAHQVSDRLAGVASGGEV